MLKKITRGVDLLCVLTSGQNKDGSDWIMNSWHPLKELKELYPLQVAEFAELKGSRSSTQSVENQAVLFQ